jgi:hypothetical protein
MIEHAKDLSDIGYAVYIMAATHKDAGRIKELVGKDYQDIKVETEASLKGFDWNTFIAPAAHPNCKVLVDHFVIESKYPRALQELFAYDMENENGK